MKPSTKPSSASGIYCALPRNPAVRLLLPRFFHVAISPNPANVSVLWSVGEIPQPWILAHAPAICRLKLLVNV